MIIKPQEWYQEKVLSCPADIVIWWWSAWAGKTFSLLLDPIRWFTKSWFRGVIFRRTMPQIKWWWWLWDESMKLYSVLRWSKPVESMSKRVFESWAEMKFSHMEYEKNMLDHQWLQYAFIWFDELTHFTKKQFFYLLSRNRSACWIKPYIRCTCNPDPDSWVREFIDWWVWEDWFIIKERDWVIRYFTIDKDNVIWWDTVEEVAEKIPHLLKEWDDPREFIKSFTFIEWSLEENRILLDIDKSYKANLMAQDEATRNALLYRNRNYSNDDNALMNYWMIGAINTNYVKPWDKYITCDVAWYGKDLAVVKVWEWLKCLVISILTKSSPSELKNEIEKYRQEYSISTTNTLYDNDGMWWWLSEYWYVWFKWDDRPIEVEGTKEAYVNLKTQLYYHLADKINKWEISYMWCVIYVDWVKRDTINLKWKEILVLDLLKQDLRAIKRDKTDHEFKKHINQKSEQKNILGRSPDLW
jgi:hypothetical protein